LITYYSGKRFTLKRDLHIFLFQPYEPAFRLQKHQLSDTKKQGFTIVTKDSDFNKPGIPKQKEWE
jgi:hypothetical protein